ncbi:MAG: DUF2520 domain-containing protein [Chloroflexi bacterium]|nr:MAG: DUF2520 domain-containing protein [Chloroflexota bacterium]
MQKPTIAIIGPGRAGSALGRALRSAGYPIAAIGGRNPDNVRNLAQELGADSLCSAAGRSVVHLSGAQDRAALRPLAEQAGLRTGVFHPLQTFRRGPQAAQNVAGTYFGIDAEPQFRDQLTQLALGIGGHPFDLSGIDRALYHAAAVFAANYPTTLLAEAIALASQAGLEAETARQGMTTLLAGAVKNLSELTPAEAITGPASRGDQGTIQRHLDALKRDPELQRLYQLLAERTKQLNPDKEAAA